MTELQQILEALEANTEVLKEIREFLRPEEKVGRKAKRNPIPYEKIKDLFNENCTNLKKCDVLSDSRKRAIKAVWTKHIDNLEEWQNYFRACNQDAWFNGIRHTANIDTVLRLDKVVRMFEEGPRAF